MQLFDKISHYWKTHIARPLYGWRQAFKGIVNGDTRKPIKSVLP